MTRRTSVALASAAALASLSLAACASAPPTASKPAGAAPPSLPQSPTMPAAEPAAIPSGPPLDLHDVHWPSASIPGQFCSIPAPVKLKGGYATASSVRWGHVLLYAGPQITYGNLGGNAGEVAAMEVMCSNGGGTADGQLADSYIIFTGAGRKVTDRKTHV